MFAICLTTFGRFWRWPGHRQLDDYVDKFISVIFNLFILKSFESTSLGLGGCPFFEVFWGRAGGTFTGDNDELLMVVEVAVSMFSDQIC